MKYVVCIFCWFCWFELQAQIKDSSSVLPFGDFHVSGYLELYVAVDDDDDNSHERPVFLYNNTRTGELALNLGFIKANWNRNNMRGNMALMAGTYAERNLATESESFRHLYEANLGMRLSHKREIWLDMGILNSHIGLESAIGKDNPTLTRSIAAENSPYYETGAQLSFRSSNQKIYLAALILNGWQRIYKLKGDFYPAFGIQIKYTPSAKLVVNYSNYFGDENPNESYGLRFFNNFYLTYNPLSGLSLTGGFDAGAQPDFQKQGEPLQQWYSWMAIVKFVIAKKLSVAARVEQYSDPNEVIVNNPYDNGFVTMGYSLNLDYAPYTNTLIRIEGRRFEGHGHTFVNRSGELREIYDGVTVSLSVAF